MVRTKIGDIFCVPIDDGHNKYFQYVANDLTQLNSDVIRAFKRQYPLSAPPDLPDVVSGDVDFYAHVVIKWGLKLKHWEKVGNVPYLESVDIMFRASQDYGKQIKTSVNWRVWRVNEKAQGIGKLVGEYQKAEIGIVVSAPNLVRRMRTGEYGFVYPDY